MGSSNTGGARRQGWHTLDQGSQPGACWQHLERHHSWGRGEELWLTFRTRKLLESPTTLRMALTTLNSPAPNQTNLSLQPAWETLTIFLKQTPAVPQTWQVSCGKSPHSTGSGQQADERVSKCCCSKHVAEVLPANTSEDMP